MRNGLLKGCALIRSNKGRPSISEFPGAYPSVPTDAISMRLIISIIQSFQKQNIIWKDSQQKLLTMKLWLSILAFLLCYTDVYLHFGWWRLTNDLKPTFQPKPKLYVMKTLLTSPRLIALIIQRKLINFVDEVLWYSTTRANNVERPTHFANGPDQFVCAYRPSAG